MLVPKMRMPLHYHSYQPIHDKSEVRIQHFTHGLFQKDIRLPFQALSLFQY
jgi:hypothetical protein